MEQIFDLLKLISPATILIALAATQAGYFAVPKDEKGKLPRWFVLIPILAGLISAPIEFLANTPTEELVKMTIGKRIAIIAFRALVASAGSVIVFEIVKRYGARLWDSVADRLPFRKKNGEPPNS
jgi:hypothetical protein